MTTINKQVVASADDVFRQTNTTSNFSTTVVYVIAGSDNASGEDRSYNSAARFTGITIPSGATITSAIFSVYAYKAFTTTGVETKLAADDVADSGQIVSGADFDGRVLTTAQVDWDIDASWSEGVQYDSPEIKAVIQELVDSFGGLSNAAVNIFWMNDLLPLADRKYRGGDSYDADPPRAAKLAITFIGPAGRSQGCIVG